MVSDNQTVSNDQTAARPAGNLQTAPRILAFGAALVLLASVTTFGLIRVNQQGEHLAPDSSPSADGTRTTVDSLGNQLAADERRSGSVSQVSSEKNASTGFALPGPSTGPAARLDRTSPWLSPQNSVMRWAGSETTLTSGHGIGDARLERIERQLSQVLQKVDHSKLALSTSSSMRQAGGTADPSAIPASLAASVAESARSAATESEIRRELFDIRVTSEVELRQLKQHVAGLSEQQKRLLKSLRKAPAISRIDKPQTVRQRPAEPVSTAAEVSQPESTEPLVSEETIEAASGVTVVSRLPLRVSVQTRSTMLTDLLAEFAKATDSGLVISTDLDQQIHAISLSEIAPQILFNLLSQNQNFEIRYEANRVELRSRTKIPPTEESPAGLAELNAAALNAAAMNAGTMNVGELKATSPQPAVPTEPIPSSIATPNEISTPSIPKNPAGTLPSAEVPPLENPVADAATVRSNSLPQRESIPDPALLNLSEPMPAPPSTYPLLDLRREDQESSNTEIPISKIPKPVELPRELREPVVSAASSRNGTLAAIPASRSIPRSKLEYRLNATVLHLLVTDQQSVQQTGMEPVQLHPSRTPGHLSAAQQVAEQAARLGLATPVSDASVSLVEGQSARLKIGWLCLHCNDESGVAAGDTLRVTLERNSSGEPRLIVQGLSAESDAALTTLGTLQAAFASGESLLVTEAGTGGNVSLLDDSSKLARLPVIGRAFRKSKQIHQTAQRLVVLTATPVELDETVSRQRTAAVSHSEPVSSESASSRLEALFTRSQNEASTGSSPENLDGNSERTTGTTFPHLSSHRPRKPHCENCEATVRSLPQIGPSVKIVQKEMRNSTSKAEPLLESRPVVFETEPADVAAPIIDLPLPTSF